MNSQDYPVQHFEMMRKLATRLKAIPVQILVHQYHYEAFGSWWIQLMKSGQRFRIVFDGKERNLRLEANEGNKFKAEWQEIKVTEVSVDDSVVLITNVCLLLDDI